MHAPGSALHLPHTLGSVACGRWGMLRKEDAASNANVSTSGKSPLTTTRALLMNCIGPLLSDIQNPPFLRERRPKNKNASNKNIKTKPKIIPVSQDWGKPLARAASLGFREYIKTKPKSIPVSQDWGKPLARADSLGFRAGQNHTCQPGLG